MTSSDDRPHADDRAHAEQVIEQYLAEADTLDKNHGIHPPLEMAGGDLVEQYLVFRGKATDLENARHPWPGYLNKSHEEALGGLKRVVGNITLALKDELSRRLTPDTQ